MQSSIALPSPAGPPSPNRFDLLAPVPSDWHGPPIRLERLPAQAEFVDIAHPAPPLAMARSGRGRRWYTCGAFTRHLRTAPGMIELYESDYQIDHGRWEGSEGELITMLLPASLIEGLQRDEAPRLQLRTRHEHFDERVRGLMDMARQAAVGSRAGSAEGVHRRGTGLRPVDRAHRVGGRHESGPLCTPVQVQLRLHAARFRARAPHRRRRPRAAFRSRPVGGRHRGQLRVLQPVAFHRCLPAPKGHHAATLAPRGLNVAVDRPPPALAFDLHLKYAAVGAAVLPAHLHV